MRRTLLVGSSVVLLLLGSIALAPGALAACHAFEVVGEAANGWRAVQAARA